MVETTTGLILRKRRLTESSLILHWLTPAHGRLATVAKGALRPKSTFRGKLDLFYEAEFSFNRSRRSDLHTLTEVRTTDIHAPLRHELLYLQQACYCAELVEHTTETETPLPEIYELMSSMLGHLPTQGPRVQPVLAFELKLLEILGMQPDQASTAISPGSKRIVEMLAKETWEGIGRIRPSLAQATEISRFLNAFILYHVGKVPRERTAALDAPA
jgi:DNA repair protein RecO (recombination protein O)